MSNIRECQAKPTARYSKGAKALKLPHASEQPNHQVATQSNCRRQKSKLQWDAGHMRQLQVQDSSRGKSKVDCAAVAGSQRLQTDGAQSQDQEDLEQASAII